MCLRIVVPSAYHLVCRHCSLLLFILYATLLAGCQSPTSPHHALPVTVRAAVPRSVTPATAETNVTPSGSNDLRSSALYAQAESSCKSHDFAKAIRLLTELSNSPKISGDDHEFCLSQIDICRKDAGLPPIFPHVAHQASQIQPTPTIAVKPTSVADADCGPRALFSVCKTLGIVADLPTLRHSARTTAEGTTMEGLAAAANGLGLKTEGVQTGRDALPRLRMPAIAWYKGNHFVAVMKLTGSGESGTATIRDPNKDHEDTIAQEVLLRRSGGYLLLVHK